MKRQLDLAAEPQSPRTASTRPLDTASLFLRSDGSAPRRCAIPNFSIAGTEGSLSFRLESNATEKDFVTSLQLQRQRRRSSMPPCRAKAAGSTSSLPALRRAAPSPTTAPQTPSPTPRPPTPAPDAGSLAGADAVDHQIADARQHAESDAEPDAQSRRTRRPIRRRSIRIRRRHRRRHRRHHRRRPPTARPTPPPDAADHSASRPVSPCADATTGRARRIRRPRSSTTTGTGSDTTSVGRRPRPTGESENDDRCASGADCHRGDDHGVARQPRRRRRRPRRRRLAPESDRTQRRPFSRPTSTACATRSPRRSTATAP
jgi:hypothetical protein